MGLYDDTANIKAIKEHTGAEKVFYLGWSQGTIQMFYALSHLEESFFVDNLYKFVAMAPCTICPSYGVDESYYDNSLYALPSVGVYDLYGPNWSDEYATICSAPTLTDDACQYASCTDCFTMSVQSESHWYQNTYTDRFQEWVPRDQYLSGDTQAELIHIETIDKIPISLLVGELDNTCPYSQAQITAGIIPSIVHVENIPGYDHGQFGQANDEWFMNLLQEQLQIPEATETDLFYTI